MKNKFLVMLAVLGTLTCLPTMAQTGFLKNEDGRYLTRGTDWGTRAGVDAWGLPVEISTESGISTVKFLDNGKWMFSTDANVWSDNNNGDNTTKFVLVQEGEKFLIRSNNTQGYLKMGASDDPRIYGDGTTENATRWTLETGTLHSATMAALKASPDVTGKSTRVLVNASAVTQTQEQYQGDFGTVWSSSFKITAAGWYCFSIQAFARMASNGVTYPLHMSGCDSPSFYAFLGNQRVQLASVFDASNADASGCVTYDGKNYPNGQSAALTAFQSGNYVNEVWAYITEPGTYNFGIANDGRITDNQHWCCYAPQSVRLTRYYDVDVEGYDEDETFLHSLIRKVGDVNCDDEVDVSDVTELVNQILGKTPHTDRGKINDDDDIDVSDVTELVNIILGKTPMSTINLTNQYALVNATVHADQSQACVTVNSATIRGIAIDKSQFDVEPKLTTLNIDCSALTGISSVSIYANDKSAIAGPMTYNCETGELSVQTGEAASVYAANMQSDVVRASGSGTNFTARLIPTTLNSGVTVTVQTSAGYVSQSFTNITAGAVNSLKITNTVAENLWMSTIPGTTYFSMVSTPGAHDACTKGAAFGVSAECQELTLQQLLDAGVRQFDIRPGYFYNSTITADNLYIWHGQISTGVLYKDAIATLVDFLKAHPSEALSIIMVKENNKPTISIGWSDRSAEMWAVVNAVQEEYKAYMKVLDHSYYTLDDFRGKICYVNRTGTSVPYTTQISNWPDDKAVTDYSCIVGLCNANVQDIYNASGATKQGHVKSMLDMSSGNTDHKHLYYNYCSSAGSPKTFAKSTNPAIATYIGGLTGPTGYILADYIGSSTASGDALLKAIIDQNYKYVFQGR